MADFNVPKEIMDFFLNVAKSSRIEQAETFKERNEYLKKNQIVFFGDSITAGFPFSEIYEDKLIYNRGIPGDTSDDLINRIGSNVLSLKPSKVFLMIGTNDIGEGKNAEYVYGNISKLCNILNEHDIDAYLLSVLHVNHNFVLPDYDHVGIRSNEEIDEINHKIKEIKNVKYIDLNEAMSDSEGNLKKDYSIDGLHLNTKGYFAYLEIIKPYL